MLGFQINFSRPFFTFILMPKIVYLYTDSILRVKMMVEYSYSVSKYIQCMYCTSKLIPHAG